jgi:hypothetical protein
LNCLEGWVCARDQAAAGDKRVGCVEGIARSEARLRHQRLRLRDDGAMIFVDHRDLDLAGGRPRARYPDVP